MLFKKQKSWYEVAKKAYKKGKLPAPYNSLWEYYTYIYMLPDFGGHYDFFSISNFGDLLSEIAKNLSSILPEDLFKNFDIAYKKFCSLGDNPEDEIIEKTFRDLDNYVFENRRQLETILENYIMTENHNM